MKILVRLVSSLCCISSALAVEKVGFTLMPEAETGITFVNQLDELDGARNRTLYNGSGVAIGDYDRDGRPDVYFCSLQGRNRLYRNLGNWKFEDVTEKAGVELFGLISRGAVMSDINADGWPDLLVGVHGGGVRTLLGSKEGRFTDATEAAGTGSKFASVTLALADVDGDGDLDLYVCNNRIEDYRDKPEVHLMQKDGKLLIPDHLKDRFTLDEQGRLQEFGEPDVLLLNDGKGKFSPVSWTGGAFKDEDGKPLAEPPRDWGLTATFRDMDGNGTPDLYVCNDYWTPDRIWLGDGKGGFRAMPRLAMRKTSASSMGVDFADIDRDGDFDALVVDMLSRDHQRRKMQMGAMQPTPISIGQIENRPQVMRNTLQLNRGDGTFSEAAYFSNLAASEWSWQPFFMDVDLDGYEDVLITSGHFRDVQDADASNKIKAMQQAGELADKAVGAQASGPLGLKNKQESFTAELLAMAQLRPRLATPIVAFKNNGDLTFSDVTDNWGTNQGDVHHGAATADLDGDGDLDFVVNNLGTPAGIYRNDATAPRIAVKLEGPPGNPDGIGAEVAVVVLKSNTLAQKQEMVGGGRYLSSCEPLLVFASAPMNSQPAAVEERGQTHEVVVLVSWPDKTVSKATTKTDQSILTLKYDKNDALKPISKPKWTPVFTSATAALGGHVHTENPFDDFARQSLLPNRLSQLGPGVTWADLNADGNDDLLVASGAGGTLGIFYSDGKGAFMPGKIADLSGQTARDQTTLAVWSEAEGQVTVAAGLANFEDGRTNLIAAGIIRADATGKTVGGAALPDGASSTGPLAVADVNGDGQLDVFVGGRSVPGKYPEPAASRIFLRQGDQFVEDKTAGALFAKVGLVSGAIFSDLNDDHAPDLALAVEWGTPMIFLNDGKGRFTDATASLGLGKELGWWNSITAGDFDADGRMDLVVGNWGRNSKYEHHYSADHPLTIQWGDLNGDGITQIIESHFDHHMGKVVPERGLSCSSRAMPFIKTITPTYEAFGGGGLADIYGARLDTLPKLSATTLESKIFFNRGKKFVAMPLPVQAQMSPIFGLTVADFDGNGRDDIFAAQNFFAAQIETPRIDAGRGLLLMNLAYAPGSKFDPKSPVVFAPLDSKASGIEVPGDARGCATADFDNDNRSDLAIAQNGGPTLLFKNQAHTSPADAEFKSGPCLAVRLIGKPGNRTAIGAKLRLEYAKAALGPAREIRTTAGYWSQDSSKQLLGMKKPPVALQIVWPGGKKQRVEIKPGQMTVNVTQE